MFGKPTLFIIGAGASFELDFPLGYGLAKVVQSNTHIYSSGNGQPDGPGLALINAIIAATGRKDNDPVVLSAARILNRGVTYNASIDDFLSVHALSPDVVRMGKLAIVQALLKAERNSKLRSVIASHELDTSMLENTWLLQLSQILLRGHTRETAQNVFENVRFITFNYDRSLEIFLIHAIKDGFAISFEAACEIVRRATIVHAYGAIGNLPGLAAVDTVSFGSGERVDDLANRDPIRTYSESVAKPELIHEQMEWTEQIVFLGFAFHPQNMNLIKPTQPLGYKTFIATTFEMSELDVSWAQKKLRSFFEGHVQFSIDAGDFEFFYPNPIRCSELMARYALSLGPR